MEIATPGDDVAAVRAFNRFYVPLLGLFDEGLLRTPYSPTEGRIIFELAQSDRTEAADLRRDLGLDAGYLSRMLARFEADGLIVRSRSESDARRQVIRLTEAGRAAFRLVDERVGAKIRNLLDRVTAEERRQLLAAMDTIRRILGGAPRADAFVLRPLRPGDLGWVVHRHGVLYAEEYGWDETFEALVARVASDYVDNHDPERENAWIAEVDGQPVGCVFCAHKDDETAQLRLLLVEPSTRGMGVGSRLVEECLRFARGAGYRSITLWTNDVLAEARRIYQRAGFELLEEEKHHSFGHDLVGQNWARAL
ncbi:MAG: GNAT family N-acetyltransferase [Streptosporangiales bacterium]|nr:GNAT family N-acetyltransferase [Streptosporangiales bacterium]